MSPSRRQAPRRRAVVAVYVAMSLVVLLGFASLTVDVGHIYVARAQMQDAVDAGALAGASGVIISDEVATSRAQTMAGANSMLGTALGTAEIQVQVGYWESNGNLFSLPDGTEVAQPNAVRVVGARPEIPLFFATILGHDTTSVTKAATAIHGGGICAGIWSMHRIHAMGHVSTDSYDSSEGAYGTGNIYLNGDLCSDQDVDLDGDVNIGGDVMYGPYYDLTINGGAYSIAGVTGPQNRPFPIPTIDMIAAAANNDNDTIPRTDVQNRDPFGAWPWHLWNVRGSDTLTLNGGTYYLNSVTLESSAQIIITGPTTFYIDGPADFSGNGILNATQDPSNLTIYSTGPLLTISGNATFYGAVIAPNTDVVFGGNSQIYGTVLAHSVKFTGNIEIHVDTNLVNDLFGVGLGAPVLVE